MMNNLLNKNSLIGALIILLLLTSWWGQSETGSNKRLTQEKKDAEVQLAAVETEFANTRQALQEKTAALTDAEEKLGKAETKIQRLAKEFSDKKSALTALNKDVKVLLEKINELELALKNAKDKLAQTGSEQQQNLQEKNAAHNETLEKLKKAETRIAQLEKEQAELRAQAEAQIAQLLKKQNETSTETESLRAQVIGFEKVVEERNASLAEVDSDLQACKVNTKVLLSKITEQENAQQGMAEKMHLMVQDLSEEATQKDTAPVQQEQPAQAK
jgi:chromosome segregation ATPase